MADFRAPFQPCGSGRQTPRRQSELHFRKINQRHAQFKASAHLAEVSQLLCHPRNVTYDV
jgi:hypothetical protein